MNTFINLIARTTWLLRAKDWLNHHIVVKQWLWFIGLWLVGLTTVVLLTYPLKILIRLAG